MDRDRGGWVAGMAGTGMAITQVDGTCTLPPNNPNFTHANIFFMEGQGGSGKKSITSNEGKVCGTGVRVGPTLLVNPGLTVSPVTSQPLPCSNVVTKRNQNECGGNPILFILCLFAPKSSLPPF